MEAVRAAIGCAKATGLLKFEHNKGVTLCVNGMSHIRLYSSYHPLPKELILSHVAPHCDLYCRSYSLRRVLVLI